MDKKDRLQQIFTDLADRSEFGIPIVVEGKKDVDALRFLGIYGRVLTVKTEGKSFCEAVDEIYGTCTKEVILMLDFDRRGKQATAHLKMGLECLKIKVNLTYWASFQALLGREIQCIEGLPSYMATLEQKIGQL
jgi:5S rRNA maturation endonuclease (ribonuclease M5)